MDVCVPHARLAAIDEKYSTDEERKSAVMKTYVDSYLREWQDLAGDLYECGEERALVAAKTYLSGQEEGTYADVCCTRSCMHVHCLGAHAMISY